MSAELLPCAHCGGRAELRDAANGRQNWAECVTTDCHAMGPNRGTAKDAASGWNRRAPAVLPGEPSGPGPTCGHCSKPWPCGCEHGENILRVLREKYPMIGDPCRSCGEPLVDYPGAPGVLYCSGHCNSGVSDAGRTPASTGKAGEGAKCERPINGYPLKCGLPYLHRGECVPSPGKLPKLPAAPPTGRPRP